MVYNLVVSKIIRIGDTSYHISCSMEWVKINMGEVTSHPCEITPFFDANGLDYDRNSTILCHKKVVVGAQTLVPKTMNKVFLPHAPKFLLSSK